MNKYKSLGSWICTDDALSLWYTCYLTGTVYILTDSPASFEYSHLVNWVAHSLQRWISSNTTESRAFQSLPVKALRAC